jgi:hypothetical protein
MKTIAIQVTLALASVSLPLAAQFAPSGTTTVTVSVGAEASLRIDTSTTALTTAGGFSPYTGTTNLTYKIRTTQTGGSGTITARVTSDFSPAGGPSVGSPPSPGDTLAYTCSIASPATACSGTQTASTSAETNVASFGADASSDAAGNAGSVSWSLTNDPAYKTGSYTATVTFTIAAT